VCVCVGGGGGGIGGAGRKEGVTKEVVVPFMSEGR
jgi:hypothetical protein